MSINVTADVFSTVNLLGGDVRFGGERSIADGARVFLPYVMGGLTNA